MLLIVLVEHLLVFIVFDKLSIVISVNFQMNKDPDVRLDAVLVVGKEMPKIVAKRKNSIMPYQHQHKYFLFSKCLSS